MRSQFIWSLFYGIIFTGCAVVPPSASYQQALFPEGINDTYFGMPLKFFQKTHGSGLTQVDYPDTATIAYQEQIQGFDVRTATYLFDKQNDQLLYEVILDYPPGTIGKEKAQELYGQANSDEGEWAFEKKEDFQIIAWAEDAKVVLSARQLRDQ